jgi:hypothetical protein
MKHSTKCCIWYGNELITHSLMHMRTLHDHLYTENVKYMYICTKVQLLNSL